MGMGMGMKMGMELRMTMGMADGGGNWNGNGNANEWDGHWNGDGDGDGGGGEDGNGDGLHKFVPVSACESTPFLFDVPLPKQRGKCAPYGGSAVHIIRTNSEHSTRMSSAQ